MEVRRQILLSSVQEVSNYVNGQLTDLPEDLRTRIDELHLEPMPHRPDGSTLSIVLPPGEDDPQTFRVMVPIILTRIREHFLEEDWIRHTVPNILQYDVCI